jgi:hypothetical protein
MSDATPEPGNRNEATTGDLASGVAGVIEAALGVGVSLARVVAEATAMGKSVPPLPNGTPALQAIVRYGVTALGHVTQAVLSGAQAVRKAAPVAAAASPAARPAGPHVQAGAVLRVPLSVENPGERPMLGLSPRVRRIRRPGGQDASSLLPADAVTFFPPRLDVAPHDFEKLVVQVAVPAEIPEGFYELILALGDDEPDLPMTFLVQPAPTA